MVYEKKFSKAKKEIPTEKKYAISFHKNAKLYLEEGRK
jgi:hypothetical protein